MINMNYMSDHTSTNQSETESNCRLSMVTLGERGQVVIPAAIREKLGLQAGDKLMTFMKHDSVILAPSSSMHRLVKALNDQLREMEKEETN